MKKLAIAATAVMLAAALAGCGGQSDETSPYVDVNSTTYVYGVPALPAAQGLVELSTSRAISALENFQYREHDGEGQWTDNLAAFELADSGSPATLDAENSAGAGGWVLTLSYYKDGEWNNCTLEDLEADKAPERAELVVYPQRGVSFANLQEAGDFINDMVSCTKGIVAIDRKGTDGRIAYAVVQKMSGGVYEITQESPGVFQIQLYAKPQWSDGSYDECAEKCKQLAENENFAYGEFSKVAPLFEEPYIEFAK